MILEWGNMQIFMLHADFIHRELTKASEDVDCRLCNVIILDRTCESLRLHA